MPLREGVIFRLIVKERLQSLDLEVYLYALIELCLQLAEGMHMSWRCRSPALICRAVCPAGIARACRVLYTIFIQRLQRRSYRGEQVRVRGIYDIVRRQLQRPDKCLLQLGEEVKRSAQKCHAAPDGLAAGKT